MLDTRHLRRLALAACLAAVGMAHAQDNAGAETRIYQQRDANGRIVLTDRPIPGAVTQRTWQAAPEDAAAAARRREQARLDALATTERIQRQLDAERQRDLELSLARAQLAESEARLATERARAEADVRPALVYVPGWRPITTLGVKPGFGPRPAPRPPAVANPLPLWRRPLVPPDLATPG